MAEMSKVSDETGRELYMGAVDWEHDRVVDQVKCFSLAE